MKSGRTTILSFFILWLTAAPSAGEEWDAPFLRDHPLVGTLWDVSRETSLTPSEFEANIRHSHFLLLGEKHDNPDHHRLQARILKGLLTKGRKPVVVMEMLPRDREDALAEWYATGTRKIPDLAAAIRWNELGWGPIGLYAPIFDIVLRMNIRLVAGDLSKDGTTPKELVGNLPYRLRMSLAKHIDDAHCNSVPKKSLTAMVARQTARDAQLADALVSNSGAGGAALIAGAGHVRQDFGVPFHLGQRKPGLIVTSVAILEVAADGPSNPSELKGQSSHFPFDYLWFTPRVDEDSPCDRISRRIL